MLTDIVWVIAHTKEPNVLYQTGWDKYVYHYILDVFSIFIF